MELKHGLEAKLADYELKRREKKDFTVENAQTQTSNKYEEEVQFKILDLATENENLKDQLKRMEDESRKSVVRHNARETELEKKIYQCNKQINKLQEENGNLIRSVEERNEAIQTIGRELFEKETRLREMNAAKETNSAAVGTQTITLEESTLNSSKVNDNKEIAATAVVTPPKPEPPENKKVVQGSDQESGNNDGVSLTNVPTTRIERSMYNNYKMLLLIISHRLLPDDVEKIKEWASRLFQINEYSDVWGILLKLDQKGIVTSKNLKPLQEFLEKITRFDLVHLINCFSCGDYTHLTDVTQTGAPKDGGKVCLIVPQPRQIGQIGNRAQASTKTAEIPANRTAVSAQCGTAVNDQATANVNEVRNLQHATRAPVVNESNQNKRKSPLPKHDMGSNGQKLSRFSQPDSDDDGDTTWLCIHYKRHCHVKFSCCKEYWPCHRCHNNKSKCGQTKLKSRDTKSIKCTTCGAEQEFNEKTQYCKNCNKKFANYFCAICKHLTDTDDNPYHCDKCGICRVHRDQSFHCDICGVCLDIQLRGNHKCRKGSAHDECCICLEDAFTGCQILPCSHKIHKECATQMIKSGMTCCPICRESFAHKLERRSIQGPTKRVGRSNDLTMESDSMATNGNGK